MRGGNWNNNANNCRVANRNNNRPDNRNNNIGFRVALHFLSPRANRPGIARFTDRASVVLKVLAAFLSRISWRHGPAAECTSYGRMGLVGLPPKAPSGPCY
ncbi:MAG TPA: hypothetical protein ENN87_13465 [Phycisphaerales bacterium]|nr:hypothetical protein [Phycisphaerales bacterium]